jgi:hypothetical protein
LFHTSNWGVGRQEVHVEELLRLPFMMPDDCDHPKRAAEIVRKVAGLVDTAAREADRDMIDRAGIVGQVTAEIEALVDEYFDIDDLERRLIGDTLDVIEPSTRPGRSRKVVPTLQHTTQTDLDAYVRLVCEVLNDWSSKGKFAVRGVGRTAHNLGAGIAVLEKVNKRQAAIPTNPLPDDIVALLGDIRKAAGKRAATLDIVRGVMVFDRSKLFIVKPIGRRYWSASAAINDADEIAGSILLQTPRGNL